MIEISPIEVLALKKLTLINHALMNTMSGANKTEMRALFDVLNGITLRADLANNLPSGGKP